jgi:FKBP-type peptidyl-prolyl cis-trans isomerase (trigger factor)
MSKTQIEREKDGTIKITITIPQATIATTYEEVLGEMAKDADIAGFRKGKAPKKLVEEKLNPDHIRENILKKVLPSAYLAAVQENKLNPIMNPKLHVEKIEEGQDWIINALTCEMPKVELGKYKDEVKKLTAKSKIVIPGKEEEQKKPNLDEVVKVLLAHTTVEVPGILVEQETDRLLSQLLDDVKRLGLSLEQYLGTTKRSPDDLRKEYAERAASDIKVEFILQTIAEAEKIAVNPQEIEEAIQKAKSPEEKQNLETNRYLLAGILRQQKTLDFLMNL